MQTSIFLILSVGSLYVVQRFLDYWRAVRSIQNLPGYRTLFSQTEIFSNMVPPMPGIAPGKNYTFINKHRIYQHCGWDIYGSVAALPTSNVSLNLADASAIKEVTSSRSRFPKPVEQYAGLSLFGRNIVASEGDEWKKYRKIAAPAFSDRNNKLVWDTTFEIMTDLFENVWGKQAEISVDHGIQLTLPLALFIIGSAGFGRKISWEDDTAMASGHQMTFKHALHLVSTNFIWKLIFPGWVFGLTRYLRDTRLAFDELQRYMSEMIRDRQAATKMERHDLFSSLLEANNEDSDDVKLTESELIGNIFIFLLAGHETTAHTLCFTFGLLALYPEEQEILYQHSKSVLSDGRIPAYEDMPLLTQSMAVFYETLRMFPPVIGVPKICAEDTSLTIENAQGDKRTIPVPAGTAIILDIPGLHYNPRYWPDPHSFKPSRFLKDWPREAFMPFSAGARACIGRKFFETEGIAILTMLVSRYKIEIKEEPQFVGESFEARRERILAAKPGITLTPVRMPLVFKLR